MKTLLYANRAEPKSISVMSILLLAAVGDITKLRFTCTYYDTCIGSIISLLRKIFGIIISQFILILYWYLVVYNSTITFTITYVFFIICKFLLNYIC